MAYLALHGCGAANGVSRLHGKVSRHLFLPLFPRWPEDEVPIGHVTNGVHVPTWDSAPADDLWTETCGKERWLGTTETLEQDIRRVSDARLWQFRTDSTKSLVEYARERVSREMAAAGELPGKIEAAKHLFDPNALTLGFARRFATYKRPNLLLRDRLAAGPLVVAGTSAGATALGQEMILGDDAADQPRTGPGLGLLPQAVVDMHFTQRQRLPRLVTAVRQRPSLLGIGIDEGTAILVCRRRFEVLGTGTVTTVEAGGKRPDVRVRVSRAGGFFDLERRRPLR